MTVREITDEVLPTGSVQRTPSPGACPNEGTLRAFFERRHVLTWLLDSSGMVRATNRTACSFCDAPTCEVLGHPIWELPRRYAAEARRRLRAAVERAARGTDARFALALRDSGGVGVTMEFSLQALPAVGGGPR